MAVKAQVPSIAMHVDVLISSVTCGETPAPCSSWRPWVPHCARRRGCTAVGTTLVGADHGIANDDIAHAAAPGRNPAKSHRQAAD